MQQLSYSDRSAILAIVERLKAASPIPDSELLRRVSAFLLAHHAYAGFEHALTRDAIALSNHLRMSRLPDVQVTARAALRYLLEADDFIPDTTPIVGFQDDAYVLSLALHEIAGLTGVPTAQYGAPRLTDEEMKLAESQLERFVDQPFCSDGALVSGARAFCDRIGNVAETGYLGRMCRNIESMIRILGEPGTSEAHLWSRGALSYLLCPADVIPDDLGLVGFLDDRYVLDTAMTMIQPQSDPWLRILDDTVERWPFLNRLILSANGTRHPLSEFLIANAALGLGQLGPDTRTPQVGVVLPEQGVLPVLLPFIATLGMIYDTAQREGASLEFRKGQKVVVVPENAVWIFDGFETVDGRSMFRLTQYRRARGVRTPSSRIWPVSELGRLRPTDEDRVARGSVVYDMARNPAPIGSIDRLFHSEHPIQLGGVKRQILSVANVTLAREIMRGLSLYGERLSDVIPMGSVTHDGDINMWSRRWRGTDAVLLFVPGLDRACDFLEEEHDEERTALLTVNGNGAIARQSVSLRRVCKVDVPVLAITRERDRQDLELLSDRGFEFFEWEQQDFHELLWPTAHADTNGHCVRAYERRLVSRGLASISTREIPCVGAAEAYKVLRELGRLRDQREDPIDELTGFIARAWELMCLLTQSVVPIEHCEELRGRLSAGFAALAAVVSASRFMSSEERRIARQVTDTLTDLSSRFQHENPKAEALAECLSGESDWTVICHDALAAQQTSAYWTSNDARARFPAYRQMPETISCAAATGTMITSPAVVVGWFGKRRMPELLQPPVSPAITLLLYDFESVWYGGLQHAHHEARRKRGGRGSRHRLLGSEGMWQQGDTAATTQEEAGETTVPAAPVDDFDELTAQFRRERAVAFARSGDVDEPDVDATIHWFANGCCAFLTDKYKAKVVTHLIEGEASTGGSTKSEVRLVGCRDLSVGDYLLFHRGSAADAIRVTADEILKSPDARYTAQLWQRALRRFRDREGLTPRKVWERLKADGCDHHLITIKNWLSDHEMIAPRDAHDHELEIIATVTGDRELRARMSECDAAIRDVWGAHLAASHHLATNVMIKVAHSLSDGTAMNDTGLLEIAPSVLLMRIEEIEADSVTVKRSMSNRIIEESHG